LWPHQLEALELIEAFIRARSRAAGGSALIRMPTGTGKSGVIAVTAHTLTGRGHVLVLAPWDALVDQLARDIRKRFWARIGVDAPSAREVYRVLPSSADATFDGALKPSIFIATITSLRQLQNRRPETYARLGALVSLVMVDEGHYEPAPDWSRAVRGLGKPVILFTATPYRNDFKFFDVDRKFFYSYSHERAERDRFVRKLSFHDAAFSMPAAFCTGLLAFCERTFGQHQPRVIVRCASENSVRELTTTLAAKGATVVGIHERFKRSADGRFRPDVPDADTFDGAQFWVHQYKLIEGIDNPAFRVLAIYQPLGNERSFVQQVGRVLRNPARRADEHAWLYAHPAYKLRQSWEAYRDYDRGVAQESFRSPAEFARSQPLQYVVGRFRSPFDLNASPLQDDFDYPRATQVFVVGRGFDLEALMSSIAAEWSDDFDLDLGPVQRPDALTRLHPYISIQNSPLLLRKAFPEYRLGLTIYRRVREYLFYFDSQGRTPTALAGISRVAPALLERLFQGATARITSVSLRNTNLGRYDVRRRTAQAYSIGELAPDLGDHTHFASTVTGLTSAPAKVAGPSINRYVGFSRARVRDRVGGTTPFQDYVAWLDQVATQLDDAGASALSVFDRYAEVMTPPEDPHPENILLDFEQDRFEESPLTAPNPSPLSIDELCLEVDAGGAFQCHANGRPYTVQVSWNAQTGNYLLDSADLDAAYVMKDTLGLRRALALIAFLNREQAFRIIPRSRGQDYSVYSRGRFYRPRVPLWGRVPAGRFDLLRILESVPTLAGISSEKGAANSATGAGWAQGSLFHLIDRLGAGTAMSGWLRDVDLLVCDDMGTEIADFIALDAAHARVVALHAKAFPQPRNVSASALHEISQQAVKNLAFFQPYVTTAPKNLNSWNYSWNGPQGKVSERIRRGGGTGTTAWERIRAALRDPHYSREVWLVLGQGLSKAALDTARSQRRPPPEAIQLLYSLQATWSSVSALGCRLRVFCSP